MTNVQPIIEHATTDNFSFLQRWYPELYRLAMDMDRFYSQDHSCALLKARLFAEVLSHVFAEKVGVKLNCNTEPTNKIKQLQSVTNVPPYIIDDLELIRLNANLGLHAYCSITNEWFGRESAVYRFSKTGWPLLCNHYGVSCCGVFGIWCR